MSWELLRTDYKDAVPDGPVKYMAIENPDGTVTFQDVTNYVVKEKAFFGAYDANQINAAVNAIMSALENGTDLYEVFQKFFVDQEKLFAARVAEYEENQHSTIAAWFDLMRDQLTVDAAIKLQEQINAMKYYYVIEKTLYIPQTSASVSEGMLMLGTMEQEVGNESGES